MTDSIIIIEKYRKQTYKKRPVILEMVYIVKLIYVITTWWNFTFDSNRNDLNLFTV